MSLQTAEYHKQWRAKNREKWNQYSRNYYGKAKERIRKKRESPEYKQHLSEYLKVWRANHVAKRRKAMRDWVKQNPEHRRKYREAYASRRRELYQQRKKEICARKRELSKTPKYRARVNRYFQRRRRKDPQFMLAERLRATMSRALKRQFVRKSRRTFELIGCTPQELRSHIERLFKPGMSWENRHLWHVDHILPLASFDLLDPAQQAAAFHYTNLQPLWEAENRRKHTKLPTVN